MLTYKQIPIVGIDDQVRRIKPFSALDRDYYRVLYAKSIETLGDRDVASAYDSDRVFRALIDAILLLCGLSPAWLDIESVAALIFGIGDAPPVLFTLNFPEQPKKEDPKPDAEDLSEFDPDAWLVAAIFQGTGSLESALRIYESSPASFLEEVMRCRAKQIKASDPKAKQKEEEEKAKQEAMEIQKAGGLEAYLKEGSMEQVEEISPTTILEVKNGKGS